MSEHTKASSIPDAQRNSDNEPTLGYLIEELAQCEAGWERAKKLWPETTASVHVEVVQSAVKQAEFSEQVRVEAELRYRKLCDLPGFGGLQIYCEAEWGEDLTLRNAKRIRGTVCKSGLSQDEANAATLDAVAAVLLSPKTSGAFIKTSGTKQPTQPARDIWQEKLEFFRAQLALASDPEQKFKISKDIEEAERQLAELPRQDAVRREERTVERTELHVEPHRAGKEYEFVMKNIGGAAAYRVTLEFESAAENPIMRSAYARKMPVEKLIPGGVVQLPLAIHLGSALEYDVIIRWTNEDGSSGEERAHVVL